jgi:hypothetical protein
MDRFGGREFMTDEQLTSEERAVFSPAEAGSYA